MGSAGPFAMAQITPDGTTATTVTTGSGGTVTVDIAPTIDSSISLNRYTDFNIDEHGVILDNTDVAASTIVNEVTSLNPSYLAGQLDVIGQRAHVVIANPNGITVDGMIINSPQTIGGLALATATVDLDSTGKAPGQDPNIVLETSNGELVVANGGLSATASTLMLMSESIRVDGELATLESDFATQRVSIFSGQGTGTLNSQFNPSVSEVEWATYAPTEDNSLPGQVIVDITPLANIRSGSISIVVGPEGAGVRSHGTMTAHGGNLEISSTGLLEIGNSALALDGVTITAQNVEINNEGQNEDSAQTIIEANAGTLKLDVVEDLTIEGAQLIGGGQQDLIDGVDIRVGGDLTMETTSEDRLAIIFSKVGDARLTVGGDVSNAGGRIISNYHLALDVTGTFTNEVLGGTLADGQGMTGLSDMDVYGPFSYGEVRASADYGELEFEGQLAYVIASGDLTLTAQSVENLGGEIHAREGDLLITADELENRAVLTGGGEFKVKCRLFCEASGSSTVQQQGGQLTASGKIDIDLTGDLIHAGTVITGAEGVEIDANDVIAISTYVTNTISRRGGFGNFFNDTGWTYSTSAGGVIQSGESITINATEKLEFEEAQLIVADDGNIDIPQGYALVQVPVSEAPTSGRNLGVFAWFLVPLEDLIRKL